MKSQPGKLVVVCFTLVMGIGTWLAVKREGRLKGENEALQQQNRVLQQALSRSTSLAPQEERLSPSPAEMNNAQPFGEERLMELLRLRGEVSVLRRETNDVGALRAQNRVLQEALGRATNAAPPSSDLRPLFWSRESLASAGQASPESALQSFLWAFTQGNLRTAGACATGPELERIETMIAEAESEASAEAKAELGSLQSVLVVRRDVLADDAVVFTVRFDEETPPPAQELLHGARARGLKFSMKKIAGEWKVSESPWH